MRVLALLDQLADDRDAGRSQQLAKLAEILRVACEAMHRARCRARPSRGAPPACVSA